MPRSQAERLWILGGSIVGFIMLLMGYFLFISPQQDRTSNVDSQVASVQRVNDRLQTRINTLRAQNADLATFQAQAATAHLALPSNTQSFADFLRTLQSIGNATLTNVTSLVTSAPVDVTSVVQGGPAAAPTAAKPTAAATPAATAPGATAPATGVGHVYAVSFTVGVSGSVSALNNFLTQLQSVQPRAVLIKQITETAPTANSTPTAGGKNGATSIQLTMYAFVAPTTQVEAAKLQSTGH